MKLNFEAMFIKLKRHHRRGILMLADLCLVSASYLLTWVMLNGRISLREYLPTLLLSWGIFAFIFFIVFLLFGMYESLWRYAEAYEFLRCLSATVVTAFIFGFSTWFWLRPPLFDRRVPISVYVLSAMLSGVMALVLRMGYRAYRTTRMGRKGSSGMKKVLLVGAGETGNAVLQDLYRDPNRRYDVVCVVDDDVNTLGRVIQRVKVAGTTENIPYLVDKHGVDIIILAIPSASNKNRKRITNICAKTKCQLKKVPDLYTFVTDATSIVSQIKDVSVEDLLGRDVIDIRANKKGSYLTGKTVLVTGAGGSIGSELCRQIIIQNPRRLVMLDISENGLYDVQQELLRKYRDKINFYAEVASVRDESKMELIFSKYKPDIIYHAAAHKHVPLMEFAPEEAIKNNVFGTLNVARCADKFNAKRFVMISTDKAVNPTNVMGATKRCCEMIIQCMNQISKTEFVAVRFGNVLGSNGSVIPLFKEQISSGGPVTVTAPEIIRYFMTISEAVSLVVTAGELANGGEIFVLDMGEPVKILELAETLIRISGYEPYKDIDIVFTGLRPGEKLFEELLMDEEGLQKTPNQKIFIGNPIDISPTYLFNFLNGMKPLADKNQTIALVEKLHELVPGFGKSEGLPPNKNSNPILQPGESSNY